MYILKTADEKTKQTGFCLEVLNVKNGNTSCFTASTSCCRNYINTSASHQLLLLLLLLMMKMMMRMTTVLVMVTM